MKKFRNYLATVQGLDYVIVVGKLDDHVVITDFLVYVEMQFVKCQTIVFYLV